MVATHERRLTSLGTRCSACPRTEMVPPSSRGRGTIGARYAAISQRCVAAAAMLLWAMLLLLLLLLHALIAGLDWLPLPCRPLLAQLLAGRHTYFKPARYICHDDLHHQKGAQLVLHTARRNKWWEIVYLNERKVARGAKSPPYSLELGPIRKVGKCQKHVGEAEGSAFLGSFSPML